MSENRESGTVKALNMIKLYDKFNRGEQVTKSELAKEFAKSEKTAYRYINDLRTLLESERNIIIEYDRQKKAYEMKKREDEYFTNKEVLALCKILLESRAFNEEELSTLLQKLLLQTTKSDRKSVEALIKNEWANYVPLKHNQYLMDKIWEMSGYIKEKEIITFRYQRQDGRQKQREVKPVAIMFSEFYFYLIAYFADDSKDFPAVFRLDRISAPKKTGRHFTIPYANRFKDGEFRKRVQFMYSGKLKKITFEFSGRSLEAVLDRIPTARVIEEKEDGYVIQAEGFGEGIEMWLGTQGEFVRVLEIK
ncbi:MAG TPA: WYL domain-containing protein [Thermotogota bacterium]|nr:WYL domain-containing protein [Thermotogota bacterium]HRW35646.1 WYL domain-containing protein [Thermotogota bacterium]